MKKFIVTQTLLFEVDAENARLAESKVLAGEVEARTRQLVSKERVAIVNNGTSQTRMPLMRPKPAQQPVARVPAR